MSIVIFDVQTNRRDWKSGYAFLRGCTIILNCNPLICYFHVQTTGIPDDIVYAIF